MKGVEIKLASDKSTYDGCHFQSCLRLDQNGSLFEPKPRSLRDVACHSPDKE